MSAMIGGMFVLESAICMKLVKWWLSMEVFFSYILDMLMTLNR